jgi:hypothetical protein
LENKRVKSDCKKETEENRMETKDCSWERKDYILSESMKETKGNKKDS